MTKKTLAEASGYTPPFKVQGHSAVDATGRQVAVSSSLAAAEAIAGDLNVHGRIISLGHDHCIEDGDGTD